MILFIFEGKCDSRFFESLKKLFFPKETEVFVCTYNSNIYCLYSKLKEYDTSVNVTSSGNTVTILNEILRKKGDNTLAEISDTDISEIYLFFDYDFQESGLTLEENNLHLSEMLEYFNEETANGKLYINYPMVESIRYTQELPDKDYLNYEVTRNECHGFKSMAAKFSFYKSLDHLLLCNNKNEGSEKKEQKKQNWSHLIEMNVVKANFLCSETQAYPQRKTEIKQKRIFDNQLIKYVNTAECKVAVLNSFPLFLYDYFPSNLLGKSNS